MPRIRLGAFVALAVVSIVAALLGRAVTPAGAGPQVGSDVLNVKFAESTAMRGCAVANSSR